MNKEIKCPHCGKVIKIDEATYKTLVDQVRDREFETEVERRMQELGKRAQVEQELALTKALAEKDRKIAELNNAMAQNETRLKLAVMEKKAEVEKQVQAKEAEISRLQLENEQQQRAAQERVSNLKEQFDKELDSKQQLIDYYKDLKARLTTKMVGETLETHCSNVFNGEMRPMFPNAYFEKDNDAKEGSKGDFIFRDYFEGTEYISIMFEMKNEIEETQSRQKHKNEDFFRKLDDDRRKKGCEYAVLVSMLEPDSDLYNGGIVDVSYRYPKMYVIRPQFFKPMITLLVNAARNTVVFKKEIELARSQNIDVTNFENELNDFKDQFGRNYRIASDKFQTAIEEIDKSIAHLQKIRDSLTGSQNQLRLANDKVEELSIKKLTRKNPTMKAKLDEARKANESLYEEVK